VIENQGDIQKKYKIIKNELISKGLALQATSSNNPITNIYAYMGDVSWQGKRDDQRPSVATEATDYDFIKTIGVKIKEGRDFSEQFNDSLSLILNQAAVDYMNLKNPVGEDIKWNDRKYKVIGIMDNVLMGSVYKPVDPMMIVYDPSWFAFMVIRMPKGDVSENLKKIEAVFRQHNPEYPFDYKFADVEFQRKFSSVEMITSISNVFASLAILISCLGLFGLAAFTAEQRTKEIGIRKVLGANVSSVIVLLSRDFAKLVLIAFVIAGPLSWWLMNKWLQAFPYRITIQWWVIALAGVAALLLAVITVSSQAVKAATANPANSLRTE
jgi:ABC-type antimicrobial peptide transport system permease subunit